MNAVGEILKFLSECPKIHAELEKLIEASIMVRRTSLPKVEFSDVYELL